MKETIIVIAHSGLDRIITKEECYACIQDISSKNLIFVDFKILHAKLGELYDQSYEQLALEQHRRFFHEIEPIVLQNPNATIAYFGLAPIPLAFHLGVLLNAFSKYDIYQLHHDKKVWYKEITPVSGYKFALLPTELPQKVEKGKGDVFIRVAISYKIEAQHTLEVFSKPTNEFDIALEKAHVDAISSADELNAIVSCFHEVLMAYANNLPDREKIHLFLATPTGLTFALGTKINPNVYPLIQTYTYSKDETPKYKEAILIKKKMETLVVISAEEKQSAAAVRLAWSKQLTADIKPFIKDSIGTYDNWFAHIIHKRDELKGCIKGPWDMLPDLSKTSLVNDTIDTTADVVENGFKYSNVDSTWQIDDGMFVSLIKRLSKFTNTDINRAGRLFLFHEGLHYSQDGHYLIEETATGIGRFPKVIEEADYQADVWAMLYEYRYSYLRNNEEVEQNLKKFFLNCIDTAIETMWSFVDNGSELNEIQIRSMNRFLNWYWQWVRIERLTGNGTLKEIIEILFDKPTIEFAGAEVIVMDRQRTCFKLNAKALTHYEIAAFYKNKVVRFAPTGISKIVEGFRQLNGNDIKSGLKTFLTPLP